MTLVGKLPINAHGLALSCAQRWASGKSRTTSQPVGRYRVEQIETTYGRRAWGIYLIDGSVFK